tara:strand:+ start:59965 stop:61494 length:1530 start_codon:yes stop_codon:yes gene_type:complete
MRALNIFISFLLLINCGTSVAQELAIEHKLKKLSYVVRGKNPSAAEYVDVVEKLKSMPVEKVLELKLDEYLKSKEFGMKFANKVSDTFRMDQAPISYNFTSDYSKYSGVPLSPEYGSYKYGYSAFHLLVREILETNSPWTDILNRKNYFVFYSKNESDFGLQQLLFYSGLQPKLKEFDMLPISELTDTSLDKTYNSDAENFTGVRISFPGDDKRIAGALTTPSFLSRYVTTGVNSNRRRAAAVFRTFLCKDMVASIPVPKEGVDENKKLALAGEGQYTENDLVNHTKMTQIHGTNVDCQHCHKQLDPLGDLFNLSPNRLNAKASIGALNYYNEDGEFSKHTVDGIGNLGSVLTTEKDYFSCQVRHFWKWIYGENSILTPSQEIELVKAFKDVNQKPQDFIKHLVMKKDFYTPVQYTESQLATVSAYKTLKKCQGCHNQQNENFEVQNLDWYALISNKKNEDRSDWMRRVKTELHKGKMPPKEGKRDFTDAEITRLNNWLSQGAPDFEGK